MSEEMSRRFIACMAVLIGVFLIICLVPAPNKGTNQPQAITKPAQITVVEKNEVPEVHLGQMFRRSEVPAPYRVQIDHPAEARLNAIGLTMRGACPIEITAR